MGLLSAIRLLLGRSAGDSTAGAPPRTSRSSFGDPQLPTEKCIVDNRVLLLGLDRLYREAMQPHERGELLSCARTVAETLNIKPALVPVEGYYADDPHLTKYFSLMRALQDTEENRTAEVVALPEFRRLLQVSSAPLYGRPVQRGKLLPVGRDALSEALWATGPEWTVGGLTMAACAAAREADDISLVGLAARVKDSVVLAALRESVVLYAEMVLAGLPPPREFLWQVDDELAEGARRFVDTFNALFGDDLPAPISEYADVYWAACEGTEILGRCVRLGESDTPPVRYYHWAICRALDGDFTVQEVWDQRIWTTELYRGALQLDGRCPQL